MRGERPFIFTNIKTGQGIAPINNFIEETGGLDTSGPETIEAM